MKAGLSSCLPDTGKGKSKASKSITHGYHFVKGKSNHAMEDYVVSDFKHVDTKELGLFAIFDGHLGHDVASYLQIHLFDSILKQVMHVSPFNIWPLKLLQLVLCCFLDLCFPFISKYQMFNGTIISMSSQTSGPKLRLQ